MPNTLVCLTVAVAALAAICVSAAYRRHDGSVGVGLHSSLIMVRNTAPLFALGIVFVCYLGALLPREQAARAAVMPKSILFSVFIFGALLGICMVIAYRRHDGSLAGGLQGTWRMFAEIWLLLVVAWIFAGYIGVLLPPEFVAQWMGRGSGWKGILIACVAGGLTPGGPFVSLPIVAVLYKAGAGEGAIVAYLSAWSLYAFGRLPFEISFLGARLTGIRLASVFVFPPLAGLVAKVFFER